jgi:hypothetical protein
MLAESARTPRRTRLVSHHGNQFEVLNELFRATDEMHGPPASPAAVAIISRRKSGDPPPGTPPADWKRHSLQRQVESGRPVDPGMGRGLRVKRRFRRLVVAAGTAALAMGSLAAPATVCALRFLLDLSDGQVAEGVALSEELRVTAASASERTGRRGTAGRWPRVGTRGVRARPVRRRRSTGMPSCSLGRSPRLHTRRTARTRCGTLDRVKPHPIAGRPNG